MGYRVLVVDRRSLFAAGLASFMSRRPSISQAQPLLDRSSLAAVLRDPWDVVVAEVGAVSEVLAAAAPGTRVAALMEDDDPALAARLLSRGVSGVCVSGDSPLDVAETIERLAAGEMRLPSHLLGAVLEALIHTREEAARTESVLGHLTAREREILALLGMGLGRVEAARRLSLSPNTVRTHIQHLLHKLSLHSQLEAAAYARAVSGSQGLSLLGHRS